jgi:hypothetical protein
MSEIAVSQPRAPGPELPTPRNRTPAAPYFSSTIAEHLSNLLI